MSPRPSPVLAAGCVVWRTGDKGAVEVLVVHRPRWEDWSLPKGKVDPGEDVEATAVREVAEETGVTGQLGESLGTVEYEDHKGRQKIVWWWAMEAGEQGTATDEDEVDEQRWLPVGPARELLTYETDQGVVDRFTALYAERS